MMLAELIRSNQPCVALTGAGVSTESGIPDFRSASGIWAQYDPYVVASIDGFRRDPERVWEFYRRRLGLLEDAQPNAAHVALAELEHVGWIDAVVTQNVDRLHERAGTRALVEVHGSVRTSSCLDCGTVVGFDDVVHLLEQAPAPACVCGRILKPDVVMFGELLPEAALARAAQLAEEARLMLVVGSTLEVYPVASLPLETLAAGGELAIVNRGRTPLDGRAALTIDAGAGGTLRALVDALPGRR
jgi:NAD-dependent deacetylase